MRRQRKKKLTTSIKTRELPNNVLLQSKYLELVITHYVPEAKNLQTAVHQQHQLLQRLFLLSNSFTYITLNLQLN